MQALVSICCPTYNHSKYIRQCLDGFLSQKTTFPFEILIFDDASQDNNQEIIKEYASKHDNIITFLQSENQWNQQKPGFFSCLLPHSKARYIALCEGDDYWTDPLKLQKQIDFLEQHPEYAICFHPVKILDNNALVADFITQLPDNYESAETLALKGNYIHTPSVVFRNLVHEVPKATWSSPIGDYIIYMLIARHGKIKQLPDSMAVYRVHQNGVHSTIPQSKKYEKWFLMLSYLIPEFDGNYQQLLLSQFFQTAEVIIVQDNILSSDTNRLVKTELTKYSRSLYWVLRYKRTLKIVKNRLRHILSNG